MYLKLAFVFATAARKYGHKVININNPDKLAEFLGQELQRQKDIIIDPETGTMETLTNLMPVLFEVKALSSRLATVLEIDTKGRDKATVLKDIAEKIKDTNPEAATQIRSSMRWAQSLFKNPQIRKVLGDRPKHGENAGRFRRMTQEAYHDFVQLDAFLKEAKRAEKARRNRPRAPRKPRKPAAGN